MRDEDPQVEEVLADVLAQWPDLGSVALELACDEHSGIASELCDRFDALRELGLAPCNDASAEREGDRNELLAALVARLAPEPAEPARPHQIARYRIDGQIGRGAQGTVYRGWDLRLERVVALKVFPRRGMSEATWQRVSREAQLASRVEHPGICTIYDVGLTDHYAYIAMQLLRGKTLRDVVGLAEPAPPNQRDRPAKADIAERVMLVEKVARGLHQVHSAGVIHRDIKPENIMITGAGEPVLLDFGLAREVAEDAELLTKPGAILGTLAYMSPEQAELRSWQLDARTDVFSLGCILFECVTGQLPWLARDRRAAVELVRSPRFPPARRLNPAISRDLATVLRTALEPERTRRYRSAQAFADDLQRVREHRPILARPPRGIAKISQWIRANRPTAVLLGAVAAILSAGVVVGAVLVRQTQEALSRQEDLRDSLELTALRGEIDKLWPATSQQVGAMEAWLQRARQLRARAPHHRKILGSKLEDSWRAERGRFVQQVEAFFADDRDAPTYARVMDRFEFANQVASQTMHSPRAAELWSQAIARVRRSTVYGGWGGLRPQLGFVPLGPDPQSGLEEFAFPLTGDVPRRNVRGELQITETSSLVFVLIPGGEFIMGAQRDPGGENYDPEAAAHEAPAHPVRLQPFMLSKFEMTQGQWLRAAGSNPSLYKAGYEQQELSLRYPVDHVRWDVGHDVLQSLELVLPTEAQWEYACRARTSTPWYTGAEPSSLHGHANVHAQDYSYELDDPEEFRDGFTKTAPVGSLRPNPFGLHDMHGNMSEWCRDPYDSEAYSIAPRGGEGERDLAPSTHRVLRGGGFFKAGAAARSSCRTRQDQQMDIDDSGLRPARRLIR
ncbi:MAG: bifunctional serine/threonine-protein kinase/formylglycine-generating enzyme family protein [Planctomycetota bacterium]